MKGRVSPKGTLEGTRSAFSRKGAGVLAPRAQARNRNSVRFWLEDISPLQALQQGQDFVEHLEQAQDSAWPQKVL